METKGWGKEAGHSPPDWRCSAYCANISGFPAEGPVEASRSDVSSKGLLRSQGNGLEGAGTNPLLREGGDEDHGHSGASSSDQIALQLDAA